MNFTEKESDTLDVLLHGSSGGMQYSLMQKIYDKCVSLGHSVVSFDFPFFERGEDQSSGPELREELEVLNKILIYCHAEKYQHVRLIGKSLGGIIAAKFLENLPSSEHNRFSIIFFGYVVGNINLKHFTGKIVVIQGENDKFGNIGVVKKDLEGAVSDDIQYIQIPMADHSFRNEEKEPVYEDEATQFLS